MTSKFEMGGDTNPKERFFYSNDIEKFIFPFITGSEEDGILLAGFIAIVLDSNNDTILKKLQSGNEYFMVFSIATKKIREALKKREILKDAPWLKKLEDKMIPLELYVASASQKMDSKKGIEDLKKLLEKIEENKK